MAGGNQSKPRQLQIEGLRAVAAILVAVFHIWLGRVSGGVDVFFVVSGYLITLSLIGHFDKYGRIQPGTYLGRLARRLFPAALLVLIAVSIVTYLLLRPSAQLPTYREITAAALYFENWQLAFSAIDYLDADAFHSPVQHFWAMSAQGQFYLIWLFAFILIGLLGANPRRNAVIVIGTASAVSLTYSMIITAIDQPFAYYDSLARVWEFGVGGLVALLAPTLVINKGIRTVLAWVGLVGVVSCGFVLQASTMFPGYAALWPVIASVCVLLGGSYGAGRFLSTRPMVWLGSFSYGIYLWHWPLLIFVVLRKRGEYPGFTLGLAIIGLAILLAWLTKVLLEDGLRKVKNVRAVTVSLVVCALVVAAGAATAARSADQSIKASIAMAQKLASGETPCMGAAAMADKDKCADAEFDEALPTDPRSDVSDIFDAKCSTSPTGSDVKECSYGALDSNKRILLLGNSHAINWFPAIEQYAIAKGYRLDVFFKSACAFNLSLRQTSDSRRGETCLQWVKDVSQIVRDRPAYDLAITSYSVGGAELGKSPEDGVGGFVDALTPIAERGTRVVAIADTPLIPADVFDCYINNLDDVKACPRLTPDMVYPGADLLVEAAGKIPNASVIDLNWLFCSDECPVQAGGVNIYRDRSHFTTTWALTTTGTLTKMLDDVIAE